MTTSFLLPPALVLIAAGLVLPLTRGALRSLVLLVAPLVTLYFVWQVPDGMAATTRFLGQQLVVVEGSKLARLFASVFAVMAFGGALFALNQPRTMELAAAFVYAGGAVGAAFAGDLITLFAFWELMAIASTLVLWSAGEPARAAGLRYAAIHFLGGVLLMAGIAGEVAATGSALFKPLDTSTLPRLLILAGFLINAAAFPMAAWLPDAYPKASWSGMVFLSAFTTKTAVLVLMRGFPGTEMLIWIGLAMVVYGIVYAVIEDDMRRIIAYALVNQGGIMLVGIGIGSELSLNGTAAHAVVCILYIALLAMAAGSVIVATGRHRCSELGGLAGQMPVTALAAVVGAASIASVPLTVGFVSKSMVIDAAAKEQLAAGWFVLTGGAAAAVLHAGLRLPWLVFFGEGRDIAAKDPAWNMRAAMVLFALLCIGFGAMPGPLYDLLPFTVDYVPYTMAHVVVQLQLLLAGAVAFFALRAWLPAGRRITLDVDWLWRGAGPVLARGVNRMFDGAAHAVIALTVALRRMSFDKLYRHHGPEGVFGRSWPTGRMTFWTTVMLGAYLILGYL
ncbi:MAG: Na(+)/H(+) antiporter subunit D [Hyphomicrobiaceae bacterium]